MRLKFPPILLQMVVYLSVPGLSYSTRDLPVACRLSCPAACVNSVP